MEPQEHTSSPGPLRSTNSHLAQDHLATDQATTTANSTIDTTLAKASTSKQQQPFDEDPTSFAPRKAAAPTTALSSPTSPSSPPASSHPSSSTSPALSSPPLLTRIPGTPPTNPPPRFFTRPYRRPIDHSHHHGSAHGAGYLNSQGSASLGVRSAFKDFVVPAQIILFFSILNALWPTLLRVVTTTIEFLVLVLSSYSACARRSDNCYFLEPLLPDGQEGAYAITIQWTLRIVFCVLFFGGCAIISKRMEKGPFGPMLNDSFRGKSPAPLANPLRPGQDSGIAGKHPDYSRMTSHDPRRTNASSAVDTDAFSAGSGSESRPRSKKSKKPRVPEESSLREMTSMPRSPLHNQTSRAQPVTSESSGQLPSAVPSPELAKPIDSKTSASTTINNASSTTSATSSSAALNSEKSGVNTSTATSVNSGILYETADDDDFISTDRRRRRRAKGLKTNLDAHSSESLIKPTPCPQEEKEATSSSQSNPSAGSTRSSPVPVAPKAFNNTTNNTTNKTSSVTGHTQSATQLFTAATGILLDDNTPHKAAGSQNQHLPPSGNQHQRQDNKTRNQHQKLASQSRRKDDTESHSKVHVVPTLSNVTRLSTPSILASQDPAPESGFIHPLHALNSTSQIVRLKPSHKRSQSAQLPAASPWSNPHTAAGSVAAGTGNFKHTGGSSLNQMTLPVNPTTAPIDTYTTSSSFPMTTPSAKTALDETKKQETSGSGDYDLFGPSSGWYSPFQSGLDITIESDQEKGRHGSRSVARPRVKVDVVTLQSQSRLTLGPFLPASSFFESSPRTPRIMPFSQHHRVNSLGFGSAAGSESDTGIGMGLSGNEDWSVRTRSSSIAAPMTPLLETDCVDPMDYFGGSRSASSSRRGSIENNLTESLLSGRARMFASSDSSFGSARMSQGGAGLGQQSASAGSLSQPPLLGNSFLTSHHFSATISSRIQAAATAAHSSASSSPVLGSQRTLELPMTMTSSTAATLSASTNSSGTGSLLSDVGFEPTMTATPIMSGATGSTSISASSSSNTAFVNPWETNYPYKSSSHTMSDTFLPFGLVPSSLSNSSSSNLDHQFQSEQDRQSSLLRLMNGGAGGSDGSSIDLGNGGDMDSRIGSQLQQHQRDDNESEAIRRGFFFPDLVHHTGVGSTSSLPLPPTDLSGGGSGSGSSRGYHPFTSVEMSLAAAANQPPPPIQEEPKYDFVELSIPDLSRKRGGGAGLGSALDGVSSIGSPATGSFLSLTGVGASRAAGVGIEGGEKRHRERGARHGRSRSGHHKSASLGSFFPPIPLATNMSSLSSGPGSTASGGGSGDHHGSPGIQGNTVGGSGLEAMQSSSSSGRHHNHGHSRLGRVSGGGGKEGGESRRSRASTGVEQQDIGGNGSIGGGTHSRGSSRHFDGSSNGNHRAKRTPKKDQQQHQSQNQNHTGVIN
ncbi:hypothetical protein BGX24_006210 [Mortierella sp. AD032]|nr:hypothetical protein BGX24_006210 [Mortierella sp. AD032]